MEISGSPELAAIIDRWNLGARREVSADDWDRLSAWEVECIAELSSADAREQEREIERLKRDSTRGSNTD